MHDFFFAHRGIDWAAAVFMFLSIWRLGGRHKDGFIFAAVAAGFWIAFNYRVDSAAGIVANAILLLMSLHSFARFRQEPAAANAGAGAPPESVGRAEP